MKLNRRIKVLLLPCALIVFILLVQFANLYVQRKLYPREYVEYVSKYSAEYNVPEYTVYSVIKAESDFLRDAQSSAGACGLMQLMPSTHRYLAQRLGTEGDIFEPEENIRCGVYYLSLLYKKYNDWTLALAAYNAGTGNVDKWLEKERFEIEFGETKLYVKKLEVIQEKYISLYYR